MENIKIQIKKKFLMPSPYINKYQYAIHMKLVGEIDYDQSPLIFKKIDGRGYIINDGQLAYWLSENYGLGEFVLLAWQKKNSGFWMFIHLNLFEDYYIRIPKKVKKFDKEALDQRKQYRNLLNLQIDEDDPYEKRRLRKEMDNLDRAIKTHHIDISNTAGSYPTIELVSKEGVPTAYQSYINKEENNFYEESNEVVDDAYRIW